MPHVKFSIDDRSWRKEKAFHIEMTSGKIRKDGYIFDDSIPDFSRCFFCML
jgi:hypothetical protein